MRRSLELRISYCCTKREGGAFADRDAATVTGIDSDAAPTLIGAEQNRIRAHSSIP